MPIASWSSIWRKAARLVSVSRVELDRDLHLCADRVANLLEGFERQLDLLHGDVLAVRGIGELVKGPDLHRRDAHRQQLFREVTRSILILPLDEIFVWTLMLADAPALGKGLTGFVATKDVVAIAGAGVVDPHPLADRAAQAAIDRQSDALAEEVPQRHVDG